MEKKKNYKMYKSGKVWVFGSITLMALNMQLMNGRADEQEVSDDKVEVSSIVTATVNSVDESPVVQENLAATAERDAAIIQQDVGDSIKAKDDINEKEIEASESVDNNILLPVTPDTGTTSKQPTDMDDLTAEDSNITQHVDMEQKQDERLVADDSLSLESGVSNDDEQTVEEKTVPAREFERSNVSNSRSDNSSEDSDAMEGTWQPDNYTKGIKWHYDAASGVLVLEGGEIYDSDGTNPWADKSWGAQVVKVVILDKIKIIECGATFFAGLVAVEDYEGLEKIDVSTATDLSYFFLDNLSVKKLDLSSWQVGHVDDMDYMFENRAGTSKLTTINISGWDTGCVTDVDYMFASNEYLTNIIGIESLNVRSLINASYMFYQTGLTQLDLSNWVTTDLEDIEAAFMNMQHLTNLKLSPQIQIDQVTKSTSLFEGCTQLTAIDLSGLDFKNITDNANMFTGCTNLKQITLGPKTNLAPMGESSVGLPDVPNNDQFTGYWVNSANPEQRLTSAELVALYSGENTPIGTFIWEINQAILNVHDVTLEVGADWNWAQSIDSLADQFGQSVDVQALYVDNQQAVELSGDIVNTKQPGTYQVTFKYAGKTVTALVIVRADQTSLNIHDIELPAGSSWQAQDAFDSATDKDGQAVDFSDVTVTGDVNTAVPGDYQITYTYGNQSQTITVTVTENKASLNLHQSQVIVHTDGQGTSAWQPQTNFQSATNSDGQTVAWSAIEVLDQPDWTVAGDYQVTYQFKDQTGVLVTATMTVTVIVDEAVKPNTSQSDLQVQNSTVMVGDQWQPSDNLLLVKDVNGNALTIADLTVTGRVDTSKVGVYEVTYQYTDANGRVLSKMVTITVNARIERPDTDGANASQAERPDEHGQEHTDNDLMAAADETGHDLATIETDKSDSGTISEANNRKSGQLIGTKPHSVPTTDQMVNTMDGEIDDRRLGKADKATSYSGTTSIVPATDKLGTAVLPQTGSAPSRGGVLGTLLLGLTLFGGWLGRRKQR
ncbi:bacterial Ig-like domain-containing protein [Lactiplantibacillus paraplantarum]|uniref:bacterial Ig-like domain-containing protein n=1 Tax=Lactiplantibacillus paraplantarum TaxID=60520 RepID=UPI0023AB0BF7|nr:bacterial Ig-like domain-containing protein [Lactiplantibacillus paraplantarum]WEE35339.1 bacterial Ig-like domain-containing protein [Lactiplantibacillus paraplantarum]